MSAWHDLSPAQRAVLELVVARGKDYAQIGKLLGVSEETVRSRVLASAKALAPPPPGVSVGESAAVVDHVLGVAPGGLGSLSAPAQRWARRLRAALAPASGGDAPAAAAAPTRSTARRPPRAALLAGAGVLAAALVALLLVLTLSGSGGDGAGNG